jgi:hypothetical protein
VWNYPCYLALYCSVLHNIGATIIQNSLSVLCIQLFDTHLPYPRAANSGITNHTFPWPHCKYFSFNDLPLLSW